MKTRPTANHRRLRPPTRVTTRARPSMRSLRHNPRTRPVLATLLILASIIGVWVQQRSAAALRDEWGPSVTAWTVVTDLDIGHVLSEDDVISRPLHPAALPADAVAVAPHGRRLLDAVGEGEIVRAGRVDGGDSAAGGSRVGSGRGAVALSTASPHLEIGDRVDLYDLFDGDIVSTDAEVVGLTDDVPLVAVDEQDIPAVIRAFTTGNVVPVLKG